MRVLAGSVKWASVLVLVTVVLTSSIIGVSILNPDKTQACPNQGLTPGWWKNHVSFWDGPRYHPEQRLHTIFSSVITCGVEDATLLEALSFHGGKGFDGAARILLRAAVAAVLNCNYLDYPVNKATVQSMVNNALLSGDRETIIDVAAQLDAWNNLGVPEP